LDLAVEIHLLAQLLLLLVVVEVQAAELAAEHQVVQAAVVAVAQLAVQAELEQQGKEIMAAMVNH
jgi:hypothetical protein